MYGLLTDPSFFSFYVELHGTPNIGTPNIGTPKPPKHETGEDDEPPLNEDDDDDDDLDDFEQGDDEPSTHHLVLAQFDKVILTDMSSVYILTCLISQLSISTFFSLVIGIFT